MTRRTAVVLGAAALPAAAQQQRTTTGTGAGYWQLTPERVTAHDNGVEQLLKRQTLDKASPWRGGIADQYGLHNAGSTCGLISSLVVCLTRPESRFRDSALAQERLALALGYLLGVVFFVLIIWGGWRLAIDSWVGGEFEGEGALRVPAWPTRFMILVGSALAIVNYLVMAYLDVVRPGGASAAADDANAVLRHAPKR